MVLRAVGDAVNRPGEATDAAFCALVLLALVGVFRDVRRLRFVGGSDGSVGEAIAELE